MKTRNFLWIISYKKLKKKDYKNDSLVVEIFTFIILYLNLFSFEMKRSYVNILRNVCMPKELYKFICLEETFYALNQGQVTFNKTN